MDSPKTLFLTNLEKAIQEWQTEGDMAILMVNMNDNVQSQAIQGMLRSVGLVDSPTTQHQLTPAMHNQGSHPIDGIFLPITLVDYCQMGYFDFGEAVRAIIRQCG